MNCMKDVMNTNMPPPVLKRQRIHRGNDWCAEGDCNINSIVSGCNPEKRRKKKKSEWARKRRDNGTKQPKKGWECLNCSCSCMHEDIHSPSQPNTNLKAKQRQNAPWLCYRGKIRASLTMKHFHSDRWCLYSIIIFKPMFKHGMENTQIMRNNQSRWVQKATVHCSGKNKIRILGVGSMSKILNHIKITII